MAQQTASEVPPHVKPEQVLDFDIFLDPNLLADPHKGYKALHGKAPEIFYTPRNGGHWVITRFDLMTTVLRDTVHFSNRELTIPKSNSAHTMIPLNLDPPDHAPYRAMLMRNFFGLKSIQAMEGTLRAKAGALIDRVASQGHCDFAEELGATFPVSVFMEVMGMPFERFEEFRAIANEYFSPIPNERYLELQDQIFEIITALIEDRRANPGNDLVSKLLRDTVRGKPLTMAELQSIGFLLFLAGLDTVANALTFAFRHLASDPALQRRLLAEPQRTSDFVEESLRCYGVVHQTRIVKKDIEIAGAHFHEGDMVQCALPLAGLDERKNPDPLKFDIDRKNREHITFSSGPHICLGNLLARAEMRIFTEEWLKRIPPFSIVPDAKLDWRAGSVMSLNTLPLQWPDNT